MEEFDKKVILKYCKIYDLDPIEVAWHKDEYTNTLGYAGVEFSVRMSDLLDDLRSGFQDMFAGKNNKR